MSKRKRTNADYEAAAASYEAEPITPDEVRSIELGPAILRMGRPAKGAAVGKTPVLAIRLPDHIREEIARRAGIEGSTTSELIRLAVVEYLDRHPA